MTSKQKLVSIKLVHTLIWIFFNAVLVYLYYAVLTRTVGFWFWMGIAVIAAECIVLMALNWTCPLTFLARRFSDSDKENFDIYLPLWLAKYNKQIYSVIFAFLVLLYISLIA